ncbi:LysR family transcriptional regulator [Pseudonocardiaceae bacterium YIM PH 21723]|nr:LysR family transcriptional regulator [Pseudonocardiaceae bacterium YIM PH 21723]
MELRQLSYFVTVAEEGNFTRAAARLNVAQPGVSAQIRRLERELGQDLLDRSSRTVQLTEVGKAALPYARAALAAATGTRLAVDAIAGLMRGQVSIGLVPGCAGLPVPDVLAEFHEEHPEIDIRLTEGLAGDLVEAVQGRQLDAAIVGLTMSNPDRLDLCLIRDENLVAAVSPDDELAGRTDIELADLAGRKLITMAGGSGIRACVDEAFAASDVEPRIAFEVGDPHVLAELACRGLGVAILPETTAKTYEELLVALPITRPVIRGRIALAWRSDGPMSPAAKVLIAKLRHTLG